MPLLSVFNNLMCAWLIKVLFIFFKYYLPQKIKQHNIDKKCFLQQISILYGFLKDHTTPKTGVIMLKIQLWSQE